MTSEVKNRQGLANLFKQLGFKKGVEVGVLDGAFSSVLLNTIPGLELIGIDPYQAYSGYRDYKKQATFDRSRERAQQLAAKWPNFNLVIEMSMDAVKKFADESIDFVYIDGNHSYDYVRDDIREWSKKVRAGGVVSGHDYYVFKSGAWGIIRAVDEYVKAHGYTLNVTPPDETADREDGRPPNWYFHKV